MTSNSHPAAALRTAALALIVALVLGACSDRERAVSPPTGAPPANTAAPSAKFPATSTDSAAAGTITAASVAAADRDFVARAASSGMLEVEASRLALERSKNDQVRTFAQRMLEDHSKAREQLKSAAASAGITDLPGTMQAAHTAHLDLLRLQSGQAFDREYAAQIGVASHLEAVATFERASQDVASSELKSYAEKLLPALREHLSQAQAMTKAVGVSADRMKAANAPPELGSLGANRTMGMDSGAAANPPSSPSSKATADSTK